MKKLKEGDTVYDILRGKGIVTRAYLPKSSDVVTLLTMYEVEFEDDLEDSALYSINGVMLNEGRYYLSRSLFGKRKYLKVLKIIDRAKYEMLTNPSGHLPLYFISAEKGPAKPIVKPASEVFTTEVSE